MNKLALGLLIFFNLAAWLEEKQPDEYFLLE